jgi:hypothetical protein
MSRRQLTEFGMIAIAIIMAFKAIESVISIVVATLYSFRYGREGTLEIIVSNLVLIIIYIVAFFIFVKRRHVIVNFINPPHADGESSDTGPVIAISQQEAIYIVFVVLAFITLISAITGLINYLVQYFTDEVRQGIKERVNYGDFKSYFIKIIIASLVIIFSKPLSEFFAKRNSKQPEFEFEKDDR